MTAYKWRREEIRKLIGMVEERDCLWNVEHKHYHNQTKRRGYFGEIAVELKIPIEEIKKKMHTLRAQYSKERSKMKMSKSGGGGQKVYRSKWEFFDLMKFMFRHTQITTKTDSVTRRQHKPKLTKVDIIAEPNPETKNFELLATENIELLTTENVELLAAENIELLATETEAESYKRRKNTPYDEDNMVKKPKDDFERFGDYVALELRTLKSDFYRAKLKSEIRKAIVYVADEDDRDHWPNFSSSQT